MTDSTTDPHAPADERAACLDCGQAISICDHAVARLLEPERTFMLGVQESLQAELAEARARLAVAEGMSALWKLGAREYRESYREYRQVWKQTARALAVAEQGRETAEAAYREARHERDNERALRLLAVAERDAVRAALQRVADRGCRFAWAREWGHGIASCLDLQRVIREQGAAFGAPRLAPVSARKMCDPCHARAALSAASTAGGAAPAPDPEDLPPGPLEVAFTVQARAGGIVELVPQIHADFDDEPATERAAGDGEG